MNRGSRSAAERTAHRALTRQLLSLDNQFCFALYAATRRVVRGYRPLLEALGLTYPQYLALLVLWDWAHEGVERPTVRALGAQLELDSGTLTPLLRRLEQKGLIRRERAGDDARELVLTLTPAGRRFEQRARAVPLKLLERCPIPHDELFQLRDQLKRLREALPP